MYICIFIYMHTYEYMYIYMYVYINICVCMYTYIYIQMYIFIYVCVCVSKFINMCVYIYTHTKQMGGTTRVMLATFEWNVVLARMGSARVVFVLVCRFQCAHGHGFCKILFPRRRMRRC